MRVTDKPRQTTGDKDNTKDSCVTSIKFAEKGYRHTLCMQAASYSALQYV